MKKLAETPQNGTQAQTRTQMTKAKAVGAKA